MASIAAPRRPDDARLYQVYLHECRTGGKRGAYRRTADRYDLSDETVRRIVHRHETPQPAVEVDEDLAYVPPPGGYPTPEPVAFATEPAKMPQEEPQLEDEPVGEVMSLLNEDVANLPQDDATECHTDELEEAIDEEPEVPQAAAENDSEVPETTKLPAECGVSYRSVFTRVLLVFVQLIVWLWQHEYRNILLGILAGLLLAALL